MIMSSFLMNSAPPYVEPKFPPSEEYSQNNYIHASPEDFYRNVAHSYGFAASVDQRRYGQENFSPNPTPYGLQPPPAHSGGSGAVAALVQEHGHTAVAAAAAAATTVTGTYQSSPVSQSPETVPSPSPTGTVSSMPPCSQTTSTPVIYPWMKKVHMGSGEYGIITGRVSCT